MNYKIIDEYLRKTIGIPPRIAFFLSKTDFELKIHSLKSISLGKNKLKTYLKNKISLLFDNQDVIVAPY